MPLTVVEKMPSGSGDTPVETTVGGRLVSKVMVTADCPAALIAVTVSALLEGMPEGAVYRPADVIAPATAVQLVAPADLNCCVAPRIKTYTSRAISRLAAR